MAMIKENFVGGSAEKMLSDGPSSMLFTDTMFDFHPSNVALHNNILACGRKRCFGEARIRGRIIEPQTRTLARHKLIGTEARHRDRAERHLGRLARRTLKHNDA